MKTGTKVYYTTISQAQPSCGVNPNNPQLSMYSNWKQLADSHPSKLPVLESLRAYVTPPAREGSGVGGEGGTMSTLANTSKFTINTHSSQWVRPARLSARASPR